MTTANSFIPYGRHIIENDDIQTVVDVLSSDCLTTGPTVDAFEAAMAAYTGSVHAIAVSSGTAALHCAMHAIGIKPGDEVIVPPMTFAATANCVVFQGGVPIFADIDADTLLIDPKQVEKKITPSTRAVIAVDYAGQPCDYDSLRDIADKYGLFLVADACHSLGATYKQRSVGTIADLTVFSFHPVKAMTTGEGGMVVTNDTGMATRLRAFRNHGITTDHRQRASTGAWFYEMVDLGYNYRITDIQCALGMTQLKKLPRFLSKRKQIAAIYDRLLTNTRGIIALTKKSDVTHAYHLYVVKVDRKPGRDAVFQNLRTDGIGTNVHYVPVHLHPFYRKRFGYDKGLCPVSERVYSKILSLPIWPGMDETQVHRVCKSLENALE